MIFAFTNYQKNLTINQLNRSLMTISKSIENITNINFDQQQILALDVGKKRIGVAICDKTQTFCLPKEIIHRKNEFDDFGKIKQILLENKIKIIVIGLPINMDDSDSEISNYIEKFANNLDIFLEKKYQIFLFDERLTSFAARNINKSKIAKNKKYYDDIAASIILESFLIEIHN